MKPSRVRLDADAMIPSLVAHKGQESQYLLLEIPKTSTLFIFQFCFLDTCLVYDV